MLHSIMFCILWCSSTKHTQLTHSTLYPPLFNSIVLYCPFEGRSLLDLDGGGDGGHGHGGLDDGTDGGPGSGPSRHWRGGVTRVSE